MPWILQPACTRCFLFTVNDIRELCPIFSIVHALKVLEILQEVFLDVPNFDEFMDVIRLDELEDSSNSHDLLDFLRDVNLLDDYQESEDDEDEDLMEVV